MDCGFSGVPGVTEPYELTEADTFMIVASDGLWDIVTGQQAMDICDRHRTAKAMSQALLEAALASAACVDNVSICVVVL